MDFARFLRAIKYPSAYEVSISPRPNALHLRNAIVAAILTNVGHVDHPVVIAGRPCSIPCHLKWLSPKLKARFSAEELLKMDDDVASVLVPDEAEALASNVQYARHLSIRASCFADYTANPSALLCKDVFVSAAGGVYKVFVCGTTPVKLEDEIELTPADIAFIAFANNYERTAFSVVLAYQLYREATSINLFDFEMPFIPLYANVDVLKRVAEGEEVPTATETAREILLALATIEPDTSEGLSIEERAAVEAKRLVRTAVTNAKELAQRASELSEEVVRVLEAAYCVPIAAPSESESGIEAEIEKALKEAGEVEVELRAKKVETGLG